MSDCKLYSTNTIVLDECKPVGIDTINTITITITIICYGCHCSFL